MRWVEYLQVRGGRRAMQTLHEFGVGEILKQSANISKRRGRVVAHSSQRDLSIEIAH
jgi:hypothetical protein